MKTYNLTLKLASKSYLASIKFASYLARKKNYYQILGVPTDASKEEIQRAFLEKTNELHPDRRNSLPDNRIGWSRETATEKFMLVKEAYDCLRNKDKRKLYDEEILLTTGGGFLMEATSHRFKDTIIDLNKSRNLSYTGVENTLASGHFRDPEKEYYAEKQKNRSLYIIGFFFVLVIIINITYVWYLRKTGQKRMILLDSTKL